MIRKNFHCKPAMQALAWWSLFLLLPRNAQGETCINQASDGAPETSFSIAENQAYGPGEVYCMESGMAVHKFGLSDDGLFGYWVNDFLAWEPENAQYGQATSHWVFQSDGNLVVYGENSAIWATSWDGVVHMVDSHLIMTTTNVILLHGYNEILWEFSVDHPAIPYNCMDSLASTSGNDNLAVGIGVSHGTGDVYCLDSLVFGMLEGQGFGYYNFSDSIVLWQPPIRMATESATWIFQDDGNLVVYQGGSALWASSWASGAMEPNSQLVLTLSSVNIMSPSNAILWSSSEQGPDGGTSAEPNCVMTGEQTLVVNIGAVHGLGDMYCLGGHSFGLDQEGTFGYFVGTTTVWSPGNSKGVGTRWVLQGDGNLVVYHSGNAVWASKWEGAYDAGDAFQLDVSMSGVSLQSLDGRVLWEISIPTEDSPTPSPDTLAPIEVPTASPITPSNSREFMFLAYYYPWYIEGDWSRHGIQDDPLLGYYGTNRPSIAEQHVEWALQAGISSWVVSWFGNDRIGAEHFRQGMLQARNFDQMKFCILYESKILKGTSFADGTSQAKLLEDLLIIQAEYFHHPSYLRVNGRPVVVVYITRAMFGQGFGANDLNLLRSELGEDVYFIADEPFFGNGNCDPVTSFNGVLDGSAKFDAYTTYNMFEDGRVQEGETASDFMLREALPIFQAWSEETVFFPNVLPMYHDFRGHKPLVGNPADFERQLYEFACLFGSSDGVDMMFVTSFNEWWEGSQIEPDDQDRYGFDFIDVLADFRKTVDEQGYYWC